MSTTTYVLATRSAGKLRELREMLAPYDVRVIDLDDAGIPEDADEDGIEIFETFEENARAKADYFFVRTGLPTLADDSGLAVVPLHGAPGVRSKRWSGRTDLRGEALDAANNAKLLAELAALPVGVVPRAAYVCVAAFRDAERNLIVRGEAPGVMTPVPRGTGGFGYDAYFVSDELGVTFGEATNADKQRVSHRGRAFSALLAALRVETVTAD